MLYERVYVGLVGAVGEAMFVIVQPTVIVTAVYTGLGPEFVACVALITHVPMCAGAVGVTTIDCLLAATVMKPAEAMELPSASKSVQVEFSSQPDAR